MRQRAIKRADVPHLVEAYQAAAIAHGRATDEGGYRAGNPRARELIDIYHELRARGPAAQDALLPLLDDDDPYVRLWVAAHALEFSPRAGEPVLEAVAGLPGFVGFDAQMSLDEWRAGRHSFP